MIDVIWWKGSLGNWDHGLLNSIFDSFPTKFRQVNTNHWVIPQGRAIVIVSGKPDVAELREYLMRVESGIVILVSDEDAYFNWEAAIPSHLEVWTQYWHPSTKGEIENRILLGPPIRIKDYKINRHLPKKYLWSFVGQVQNKFREECVEVLKTLPDGYLQICSMFGGYGENGMDYQQYLDIMCQSRFVICPAGSMTADTFRLYEAMECGAVPITNVRSPRDSQGFNYWNEVYFKHNLLTINDWDELPLLLDQGGPVTNLPIIIRNEWWFKYKEELTLKLLNESNKN